MSIMSALMPVQVVWIHTFKTISLHTNWHWIFNSVSHLFAQTEIDIHMWHLSQLCLNNATENEEIVEKNVHRMALLSHLMVLFLVGNTSNTAQLLRWDLNHKEDRISRCTRRHGKNKQGKTLSEIKSVITLVQSFTHLTNILGAAYLLLWNAPLL